MEAVAITAFFCNILDAFTYFRGPCRRSWNMVYTNKNKIVWRLGYASYSSGPLYLLSSNCWCGVH